MDRRLEIGNMVIFVDALRKEHNALITAIWGNPEGDKVADVPEVGQKGYTRWPCINLLYVSDDESRTDQYGRQIDRVTSIVHQFESSAAAMCYRFLDEDVLKSKEVIA